ncbi:MAG: DUF1592 domain-containing protein [Acidobacteriota bacterium]
MGVAFPVTDLEFASRLSFFLWSSIPDDELLDAAAAGKLRQPAVLDAQIKRMLADPRSESMVTNFAAQWLFLRDLEVKEADLFLFRDFDLVLRKDLERETELFLNSILRENRPMTDLVAAKYTFLNERLAKHYEVPNIQGSYFRKVTFPADSPRGGLLGQASVLMLTSTSTRTSPVVRGKYILDNLLASPPPPPPPNVPSLKTEGKSSDEQLSMREAMTLHRASPPAPLPRQNGSHRILHGELRRRGPLARRRLQREENRRGRPTRRWHQVHGYGRPQGHPS